MTLPGGQEPPLPTSPPPSQSATGVSGTAVQIGGHNYGNFTFTHRPKLRLTGVSDLERQAASEPQWAHTVTPGQAANLLVVHGLAVVTGSPGTGRRTSAVRALLTHLGTPGGSATIWEIATDWSDDSDDALDEEVLPDPVRGNGYLIDATLRPLGVGAARVLENWAGKLSSAGSALAVIGPWPGDKTYEVVAKAPDAVQVACGYLRHKGCEAQAAWLELAPQTSARSGLLRQPSVPDPTVGIFSKLITTKVSPADAVDIAQRLGNIRPEEVADAVARDRSQGGTEAVDAIRDRILLWTGFLERKLTEAGTRGQDRVMLLSAAYLEGAPLELCIKAATAFGSDDERVARRFREGRSPRRRLLDVGVDITELDTASFERHPRMAGSAIRMDWHHWADERSETMEWLARITGPDGVAKDWISQIGDRLLALSRTAAEPPFFKVLETWSTSPADSKRHHIVAALLTQAAMADKLAREAHQKVLDWAKKGTTAQRVIAARVCNGSYGAQWPGRSLVRLRHLLGRNDEATPIAAAALSAHAARSPEGLEQVVNAIGTWTEEHPQHPGGPRAFLTLADPQQPAIATLVTLAPHRPAIQDFLITGWMRTLQQPDVRDQAHQTLVDWARAVQEDRLERVTAFRILTDVRNAHTPVDALSRFLYGSPDHDDQAVIDARLALASLPAQRHRACPAPQCPLNSSTGTASESGDVDQDEEPTVAP